MRELNLGPNGAEQTVPAIGTVGTLFFRFFHPLDFFGKASCRVHGFASFIDTICTANESDSYKLTLISHDEPEVAPM